MNTLSTADLPVVRFDGQPLTLHDIAALAERRARPELSRDAAFRDRITRGAEFLDRLLREDGVVYGVTTGYGDSCTVKIDRAGTYPYFCSVHVALGMKGTIIAGAGGGSTTTTATTAGGSVVAPPSAASPPPAGRPAIYWAGWGLFAAGALMALVLIALYVRFSPGFNREKR